MKARIVHLHNTEAGWNELCKQQKIIPKSAEFIIYDPDESYDYARLKIGDGQSLLQNLPFFVNSTIHDFIHEYRPPNIIDGGRIENYIE